MIYIGIISHCIVDQIIQPLRVEKSLYCHNMHAPIFKTYGNVIYTMILDLIMYLGNKYLGNKIK